MRRAGGELPARGDGPKLGLGARGAAGGESAAGVCALSGTGRPARTGGRAGHDLGYAARAGLLAMGGRDGAPAMPGTQIPADIGGAWVAVSGILAALLARATTGRGRLVDVSLVESASRSRRFTSGRHCSGFPSRRRGTECWTAGSRRTAFTARRTTAGLRWPRSSRSSSQRSASGSGSGNSPPRRTGAGRGRSGCGRCWRGPSPELRSPRRRERLAGVDACVEPVLLPEEVCGDAHLGSRGLFPQPRVLATPLHLGPPAAGPAPGLGEHTREVLLEAGLTPAEMNALG